MSTEQDRTSSKADRGVWGESDADIWERRFEPQRAPLFDAVIESIDVQPGTTLLDAGCGGGGLALAAHRAGARVFGCDLSESMLARAQSKVPAGEFRAADIVALPFADDSFDIVVACDCLLSARDAKAAIAELSRVGKPTGALCIAIWEEPRTSDLSRVFAAMRQLSPIAPAVSPLALSGEGVFDALLRGAGLRVRTDRSVRLSYRFASFDDFWSIWRVFGGIKFLTDAVGESRVRTAVRDAIQASIRDDGELVMNNAWRLVVASAKPA
ncbi:MAG: class I SAM-dependent methyltransferase [Candidatus Binatia bacterium]